MYIQLSYISFIIQNENYIITNINILKKLNIYITINNLFIFKIKNLQDVIKKYNDKWSYDREDTYCSYYFFDTIEIIRLNNFLLL